MTSTEQTVRGIHDRFEEIRRLFCSKQQFASLGVIQTEIAVGIPPKIKGFTSLTVSSLPTRWIPACVLISISIVGSVRGQESTATKVESKLPTSKQQQSETPEQQSIRIWIEQLGSKGFTERLAATKNLRQAGDAAIGPLTRALQTASAEQRARIESLLNSLQKNSFSGMLNQLKGDPAADILAKFPQWSRYSKIVGTSLEDRRFYVRMLQAESQLFTIALKDERALRTPLRDRAAQLLQETREAVRKSESVNMDSYAALLLLAGNSKLLLRGDTSTSLNSMLMSPAFEEKVQGSNGARLLKLAGAYVQRPSIAVVDPLRFARKFETADGLKLARRVLKSVLRGVDGQMALIVIKEQGDESDLPLLESLFDHPGILIQGRRTATSATQSYTATNGDLAVAVAISLRGQDPRDYGFSRNENVGDDFRLAPDTIGFLSEEARKNSRRQYQDRWLTKADQ